MWTARSGVNTDELAGALSRARDAGVAQLDTIAATAARDVGLDTQACLAYLRDNLHFTLGPAERQGLRLFYRYASQFGFAPADYTPETIGPVES
jgi:chorismate dehydratase